MGEPAESEVETVALYGAIFGASLLLLSTPLYILYEGTIWLIHFLLKK